MSASRAVSMSATTRYRFSAEPGAAVVSLSPNWIEHGDPGGVIRTILTPLSKGKSASRRQPSPP